MPGKYRVDPTKTQQQEIADLKEAYLQFFREFPVQKAAADFIGRDVTTVQGWARSDADFQAQVSRAKAESAKKHSNRVRPDSLLANLYDELRPPKQEVDAKVTTIEGQSAEDLLAEAKKHGLDTSQYESLLTNSENTRPTEDRAPDQGSTEERT